MDLEKAVVVKTFLKLTDADLAAAQLRGAGIECAITSDDAGGVYPALALIKLLVDPDDAPEARRLLDEPVAPVAIPDVGSPVTQETPTRPAFPMWPLFVAGMIVGILIHGLCIDARNKHVPTRRWNQPSASKGASEPVTRRRGTVVEQQYDQNHDGRPDDWVFYEKGVMTSRICDDNFDGKPDEWHTYNTNGLLVESRYDRNYDSKADSWTFCQNGLKSTGEADNDFDGRVDTWFRYGANDVLVEGRYDRNADGQVDDWSFYREGLTSSGEADEDFDGRLDAWFSHGTNGVLVESRYDRNRDGRADVWNHFVKGVASRTDSDDNFDGNPDGWLEYGPGSLYERFRFDSDYNGVPDATHFYKDGVMTRIDWQPNGTNIVTIRLLLEHGMFREELRDEDQDGQFDVSIKYGPFANPIQTNRLKLLSTPAR